MWSGSVGALVGLAVSLWSWRLAAKAVELSENSFTVKRKALLFGYNGIMNIE